MKKADNGENPKVVFESKRKRVFQLLNRGLKMANKNLIMPV